MLNLGKKQNMEQESIHLCPIVFCQQILQAEQEGGGDSLPSLINIFDGIINYTGTIEFYLFTKATAAGELRENYEFVIEVFAPSKKRVVNVKGYLKRSKVKTDSRTGDVMQLIHFVIEEDGDYLVTVKFQDEIVGQTMLHVARNFASES